MSLYTVQLILGPVTFWHFKNIRAYISRAITSRAIAAYAFDHTRSFFYMIWAEPELKKIKSG
jgi:hypothetical protein